ncbi:MAG: carboxypeptidase-like regulatory domain-containing protein [Ferruginibacter sp.]
MKTWAAADFERYHSGKMTAAEMYALEKAALEDPFLQDALDGYVHTKTPFKDLEDIRQKLPKPAVQTAPVINTRQKRFYNLLKIAAVLVLFAGFAWLLNNSKAGLEQKDTSLAKAETKDQAPTGAVPENKYLADSAQAGDFAVLENKPLPEAAPIYKTETDQYQGTVSQPEKNDQTSVAAAQAPVYPAETNAGEKIERKDEAEAASQPVVVTDALKGKVAGAEVRELNTYWGMVTDPGGEPVVGATVYAKDKKIATQTDSKGKYVINTNDTVLNLTASAVGYNSKQKEVRADDMAGNFVLEDRQAALNEVVVTSAAGIKRQKKEESVTAAKSATRSLLQIKMPSNITLKNADLVSGQTELIRFANDSLRLAPEKGSVELAFDTDDKGSPVRIKVIKPLCSICDELAVKLLQQAAWKKIKKGKKAAITVNFQ